MTGSAHPRTTHIQLPHARPPQTFSSRSGVLPPSLIRDLPLQPKHLDRTALPPSSPGRPSPGADHSLVGAVARTADRARSSVGRSQPHPHAQTERLLAQNPELLELYRSGILPGRWQILNSGSVSDTPSSPMARSP